MKVSLLTPVIAASCAFVLAAALAMACSGGDEDSSGTAGSNDSRTETPLASAPTTTPTPTLEEEILEAYMGYLQGYKEALLNLDVRLVENFAGGQELARIRREIDDLRAKGLALRLVTTHNPVVIPRSAGSAAIVDEIVDNSFFVDAETKDPPVASGSGEVRRQTFTLEKVSGRWIVTRAVRSD